MKQKLHLLPNKKLIDLGCGDGKVLRFFDKEYLCSQLDGCDVNPVAIRRGKFLNLYNKQDNISLTVKDLRETHLGSYDYIFLFLVPTQLDAIQSYLQNNIKSDAIIICNTFQFSDRKPYHEIYSDDKKTRISFYRLDTIVNRLNNSENYLTNYAQRKSSWGILYIIRKSLISFRDYIVDVLYLILTILGNTLGVRKTQIL